MGTSRLKLRLGLVLIYSMSRVRGQVRDGSEGRVSVRRDVKMQGEG